MDRMRRISELTTPAVEPVTLDEVKAHLRVTNTSDDLWLTAALKAARLMAEDYTHMAFIQRTFRQTMDWTTGQNEEWWNGVRSAPISVLSSTPIELLKPPLVSVQSVTVFGDDDTPTVVDPSIYIVDAVDQLQYGRVVLRRGNVWPVVLRVVNGLQIDFTAGLATAAVNLPQDIPIAIKMIVMWLYENRGCESVDVKGAIAPSGAGMILDSYRMIRF